MIRKNYANLAPEKVRAFSPFKTDEIPKVIVKSFHLVTIFL